MFDKLKISTYNSQGHGSGRLEYISDLLNKSNIIFWQEHWYFNKEISNISSYFKNYDINCHGISGMDDNVFYNGRPFGGCAILWHSSILADIKPILSNCKRLAAIKVTIQDFQVLMFNVYMPTSSNINNVEEMGNVLSEISSMCYLNECSNIIIGGDFNLSFTDGISSNQSLKAFMDRESLQYVNVTDKSEHLYTFNSKSHYARSHIDHFIVTGSLIKNITSCEIIHDGANLSDHSPVTINFNIEIFHNIDNNTELIRNDNCNWKYANEHMLHNYKLQLDDLLSHVNIPWETVHCCNYFCEHHCDSIEKFHSDIVSCCLKAGLLTIPIHKPGHKVVPGWNDHVKRAKEKSLFWHTIWRDTGSPHEGIVANIMRATRAQYHYAIRQVKRNSSTIKATKMANALLKNDHNDFWSHVKKFSGSKTTLSNNIDGIVGQNNISELFADKYDILYKSVGYDKADMDKLYEDINNKIINAGFDKCLYYKYFINVDDISENVNKIKLGKTDGSSGIYSNHIINAGKKLHVLLSLLFNMMLVHGYSPHNFLLSTLVPIPKNKRQSLSDSDNYRAIALSNCLGKLLDNIILSKFGNTLSSCDLQFGFKKGHSTNKCTFVVNEIINYYNERETNVYVTLLDASKAFDRVNYIKLFRLLLIKGLCPIYCRLLLNLYTNQKLNVKWGAFVSKEIDVKNGVKQGGVLSPILFTVYIDVLLKQLEVCKVGCHIRNIFLGALGYADDIILLSPTLCSLHKMLSIANSFSNDYDIIFNIKKTKFLVFPSSKCDVNVNNISFDNVNINKSECEKHLGVFIGNNANTKNIQNAMSHFICQVNFINSVFKNVNSDVKIKLFNAYCMPLYGSVLWDFTCTDFVNICTKWRQSIRKLLNITPTTHNSLIHLICDTIPFENQIYRRFLTFLNSMKSSSNVILNVCLDLVINGSSSTCSGNLSYICSRFNINRFTNFVKSFNDRINYQHDDSVLHEEIIAGNIKDLIYFRDNNQSCFTTSELQDMLDYLCHEV